MNDAEAIQAAIEEWAVIAGGPQGERPTLAEYIVAKTNPDYVHRSQLRPVSSVSRRWNADGSLSCNHPDAVSCALPGHTTVILYEIPSDEPRVGS